MKRARDLEKSGHFHRFVSDRADNAKKRQHDMVDEQRVKQPEDRPDRANRGENPAPRTVTEQQPPAGFRSLEQEAQALEQKVGTGQPVTASGRKRDHHFMDQTR